MTRRADISKVEAKLRDQILSALSNKGAVRRKLPGGGRIHVDRLLPFLVIHFLDSEGEKDLARGVTIANASYLLIPAERQTSQFYAALIDALCRFASEQFGGVLLAEIFELARDETVAADAPVLQDCHFAIAAGDFADRDAVVGRVEAALEGADVSYRSPSVTVLAADKLPMPDGHGLVSDHDWLAIAIPPVYRQPGSDGIYPEVYESLEAVIFDALLQGAHAYAQNRTQYKTVHHRALGRSTFYDVARKIDRGLEAIGSSFDFLLSVTPINAEEQWQRFADAKCRIEPELRYRPLTISTDEAKSRLFSLPLDRIEDPPLEALFREKQHEIGHQLTMLQLRNTDKFSAASLLVYGGVEPELLRAARQVLDQVATPAPSNGSNETVDCDALFGEAQASIRHYQKRYDKFHAKVEVRDDLPAGLMVSGPSLFISRHTKMAKQRVDALIQHEIGIHLLTYFAGDAQPLTIFRSGLAGYEGVQEGLGVFAEYVAGGLSAGRLRLLAGRVLACKAMLEGATFVETFEMLSEQNFAARTAFNITLRIYRSGGLSKDAIYLRGLLEILAHLREEGDLEPFWFGKIATAHIPVMVELKQRGMLVQPPLKPAFLERDDAGARLAAAKRGLKVIDLVAR